MVDRYVIHDAIASGGMASIHLARLQGEEGFSRVFAVKRLHPHLARDPEVRGMLAEEARTMARIRHGNVVAVVDVVSLETELLIVMEYVPGASLAAAWKEARLRGERAPPPVAVALAADVLRGLHAAHEARDERGRPLGVIHRDVSPHNVLVGTDGVARVLDFGVARVAGKLDTSRSGWKGKPAYMAPEQLRGDPIDVTADVWGASVLLWETLTGHRLFSGESDYELALRVSDKVIDRPRRVVPEIPRALDDVVVQGLARVSLERFSSAGKMAAALEDACPRATVDEVADWLDRLMGEDLKERARYVREIEAGSESRHDAATPPQDARMRPPPRATRLILPVAAGISVAVGVLALVSYATNRGTPVASPASADVPMASKPEVAAIRHSPGAPVHSPSASASETPPASGTSVAEPAPRHRPAPRTPVAPQTARKRPATPSPSSSASKPNVNCNPPYVVDQDGIQRLKTECL